MGNSFFLIKQNSKFKYIYTFISKNILNLSYVFSYKDVDRGFLEKIGPSGIVQTIKVFFNKLKNLQSGFIYHYLFLMFVSSLILIVLVLFPVNSITSFNLIFFLLFIIYFF